MGNYICSVCGKHYSSKADMYACMSEDYKKEAEEAKKETSIDLKLYLYEGDILAAANKLKEQIARYNVYARENDRPAYTGRIEVSAGSKKIAYSFFPSISRDPIKVSVIPDEPIKRKCSCGNCSCGKKEEKEEKKAMSAAGKKPMTIKAAHDLISDIDINELLDNLDDPDYWAETGLLDACNALSGFNVTKEDIEKNIDRALNDPLIKFQSDMLRKTAEAEKSTPKTLEELLNEALEKEEK